MSDDLTTAAETTATVNAVADKLREFGAGDEVIAAIKEELGVATLDDLALLNEKDFTDAGMKTVPARRLLASLKPATQAVEVAALSTGALEILPAVPSDESWLNAVRIGGILRVEESTVIAAIRAALADKVGLFALPAKIVELMEEFAKGIDEPVGPDFYRLRKLVTRHSYAEIFEAIDGLDGSFVTETRKRELFSRINTHLWPAILTFNMQLQKWQQTWMQQGANPAALMVAIASMGSGGMAMPPGMIQPPETDPLRDFAAAVADAANKVFAGTGVQIATALAYDAMQIKQMLENPQLPAMIGATNRDQMLRQLDVAVSAAYPRLETSLSRYVLACLQAQDQPAGDEALRYFASLAMLGAQIPWDMLSGKQTKPGVTTIGGNKALTGEPRQTPLNTGYSGSSGSSVYGSDLLDERYYRK